MSDRTPRARAKPAASELAERRADGVAAIRDQLARGEWTTGSAIQFAAEWGITARAASEWAGEASRQLLALEQLDAPALRSMLVARLERHEAAAGAGSREAIQAVSKIAEIEGLAGDRTNELVAAYMTALFAAFHEKLPPEVYAQVMEAAQGVRLERARLGKAIKVTVSE